MPDLGQDVHEEKATHGRRQFPDVSWSLAIGFAICWSMWFVGRANEMDPEMECNICDQFKHFNMMICLSETKAAKKKVQKRREKI